MSERVSSREFPRVLLVVHSQEQDPQLRGLEDRWPKQPRDLLDQNSRVTRHQRLQETGSAGELTGIDERFLFLRGILRGREDLYCSQIEVLGFNGRTGAAVRDPISPCE